jgi:hypothetical protein
MLASAGRSKERDRHIMVITHCPTGSREFKRIRSANDIRSEKTIATCIKAIYNVYRLDDILSDLSTTKIPTMLCRAFFAAR